MINYEINIDRKKIQVQKIQTAENYVKAIFKDNAYARHFGVYGNNSYPPGRIRRFRARRSETVGARGIAVAFAVLLFHVASRENRRDGKNGANA